MGKKRTRKKLVSKGKHSSISRSLVNAVRSGRSELEKMMNKVAAWKEGKNPWITVQGTASNRQFVKVRANELYGSPKPPKVNVNANKGEE
jgi:hypothetical protein